MANPGRQAVYTTKPIDRRYEYAPAVISRRAGLMFISGMVGWDENGVVLHPDDAAAQAMQAFENLKGVLAEAGLGFGEIVMETEYVVDMCSYPEIAKVRRDYFGDSRPAATLVEVRRLFRPELLFEIQAIAITDRA